MARPHSQDPGKTPYLIERAFTRCGLPGIGEIPYGTHMCHFYDDRDRLLDALVPYFAAGLRARERCIWITSHPLCIADAALELERFGVDVKAARRLGDLVLAEHADWYLRHGSLSVHALCDLWLREEQNALAAGYAGLRVAGNTGFLTAETWAPFMDYERAVDEAFKGRRIVALCAYAQAECAEPAVSEVMHRHQCALERPGAAWQVVTPRTA